MNEKLVGKLECNHNSFVMEGGLMESYDNVVIFLDNLRGAKKVFHNEKRFPVRVGKKSPMYKREGYYWDVYHLNGCTVNVHRHFERQPR